MDGYRYDDHSAISDTCIYIFSSCYREITSLVVCRWCVRACRE